MDPNEDFCSEGNGESREDVELRNELTKVPPNVKKGLWGRGLTTDDGEKRCGWPVNSRLRSADSTLGSAVEFWRVLSKEDGSPVWLF